MQSINSLFPEKVTKITNSLLPPQFIGDKTSIRNTQNLVKRVIDYLGAQSAEEQGLGRVITTAEKLRTADSHSLYLLKDSDENSGAGEMVGLLKVGKKHLYVYDDNQKIHEVEPICVLDFFIRKSHQRRGLGKFLFDFMLKDQKTSAEQLAVDGPSATMRAFLAKNYQIQQLIKQPNNFAVSPQLFNVDPVTGRTWTRQKNILSDDRDLGQRSSRLAEVPHLAPGSSPAGRFTARHPASTMGNVIHGDNMVEEHSEGGEKCEGASSDAPTPTPASSPLGVTREAAGLATGGGDPQRPSSLAVAPAPPAEQYPAPATPAGTPSRRDSQLTDKGFFDVKFYHKKLW